MSSRIAGANTNCTFTFYWDGSVHGYTGERIDAFTIAPQAETGSTLAATEAPKADGLSAVAEDDADQVDDPEEEDIPADDEDDADEVHNLDDINTRAETDNTTIFLPLLMKSGASGTTLLPDVVVGDISLSLVADNTCTITLIARNQGGAVSYGNNFFVNAYLNSNLNSPIVVCSVQATDMGSGQSVTCTAQYTFNNGTDTLRGWVGPYNHVAEGDEDNNTLEAGVVALDNQGASTTENATWPAGPLPTPTPNAPQR